MSKPRVLITMEGGIIQSIASTTDIDIIINDYDNDEEEDQIIRTVPDEIFKPGEAYKLIRDTDFPLSNSEQLLKEYLKDEKF